MRIKIVEIEGFRSIKARIKIHLDPVATVVLGANDHGKTNLLEAMTFLNPAKKFDADGDLNWDREDQSETLPYIAFQLQLSESERGQLQEIRDLTVRIDAAKDESETNLTLFSKVRSEIERLDEAIQLESVEIQNTEKEITERQQAITANPQDDSARSALSTAKSELGRLGKSKEDLSKKREKVSKEVENRRFDWLYAVICELLTEKNDPNVEIVEILDSIRSDAQEITNEKESAHQRVKKFEESFEAAKQSQNDGEIKKLEGALATSKTKLAEANKRLGEIEKKVALVDQVAEFLQSEDFGGRPVPTAVNIRAPKVGDVIVLERSGLDGKFRINLDSEAANDNIVNYVISILPEIQIVKPIETIPDNVTFDQIEKSDDHSFMRGIFYYAGIDKSEWKNIFVQNDKTMRRLRDASETLNDTLSRSWSQGNELDFYLGHNSKAENIELTIQDPAVGDRFVRASRRSSGFTHFFALKTILHAHEMESGATSYVWLFDEPGLHLHPCGQHDLIQVLETLAQKNQVVYSTHSIFLLNKNHPTRHCLIKKGTEGTQVDSKPFSGHWQPAIDALGLSLPGTVLFAAKILLVEGDSDPIFINAILQKLIQLNKFDVDINSLAIVSTGDSSNSESYIRIFGESPLRPKMAFLFDGDQGGRDRKRALDGILKQFEIAHLFLDEDSTIEDHLISPHEILIQSVAKFIANRDGLDEGKVYKEVCTAIEDSLGKLDPKKISGIANATRDAAKKVGKLQNKPSSVGMAREYSRLLLDCDAKELKIEDYAKAQKLARRIAKLLDLPARTIDQDAIVG